MECCVCYHKVKSSDRPPKCNECVNTYVCGACTVKLLSITLVNYDDTEDYARSERNRLNELEYCSMDHKCPTCRTVIEWDNNEYALTWLRREINRKHLAELQVKNVVFAFDNYEEAVFDVITVITTYPFHLQVCYTIKDDYHIKNDLFKVRAVPIEQSNVNFKNYDVLCCYSIV